LAAWANTAALPFEAYKSANSRLGAATTVRLLYDDERLYVRYECSEPNIDNLKLKSVGRDGNVYYLDEVELFLNPECSSRKMMHFMAAPVKDAMYDERKGYIDDPLDPRYSAVDIAWNADWTYTYTIDKENKRWFLDMAVPFKSIGAGAPASGTVWTVNFARARRAGDFEELSCWIAEDFGNPEVFGELIFGDKGEKPTGGTTPGPQSNKTVKQSDQSVVAADSAGNEIVKNGGFEKVGDDKKPVSWAINSWPELGYQPIMNCCSVTTEKAHGGQSSLKIDFQNIKPDATWKSSQIVFGQVIDAETVKRLKGKDVVLSAWLYYEYRDEDSKGGEVPGPYIIVRASDKDEKLIPNSKSPQLRLNHAECSKYWIDSAQGIGKWIRVEQRGQIPDAAEHLDIHCGLVAWDKYSKEANATSVYIDDIRLEVVESQKKSV